MAGNYTFKAQALMPKLSDADADIRYMSLNDLQSVLQQAPTTWLQAEQRVCASIFDGIIRTLDDTNGEVQNQAIECVGALVAKVPYHALSAFVYRITTTSFSNSVDASIQASALRTFITAFSPALPRVQSGKKTLEAYTVINKVLLPRLFGQATEMKAKPEVSLLGPLGQPQGVNGDALDVLTEIIRCFGSVLDERERSETLKMLLAILDDSGSPSLIKKKAVGALSLLAVHLPDRLFTHFTTTIIDNLRSSDLSLARRRLFLNTIGSLSKSAPARLNPHIDALAPWVLKTLSSEEFEAYEEEGEDGAPNLEVDDVREAALTSLESLLSSCPKQMSNFSKDSVDSSLRFLKYDPMATASDDEEMGGTQGEDSEDEADDFGEEEDFEEEGVLSDDDDSSWKIRRCAVKNLYAVISTQSTGDLLENGILYDKIAPALIHRFEEREDNVKIEILTTLSLLVRKTGDTTVPLNSSAVSNTEVLGDSPPRSRKRRRVDSNVEYDASLSLSAAKGLTSPDASPISGAQVDLARLTPDIVRGIAKLLKKGSVTIKESAFTLLRNVVVVQSGSLSDLLDKVLDPIVETITGSGTTPHALAGAAASTAAKMRLEALELISAICDTHSSKILSPYIDSIVSSVVVAIGDKYFKVASQGLIAAESIVKALTPPRSAGSDQQRTTLLSSLYETILVRASTSDADLEVRRSAIHALGVLLARTCGPAKGLLATDKRAKAKSLLLERLRNETTRVAAVTAVDLITIYASESSDFEGPWLKDVAVELAAQLRKADRVLRNASLTAVHNIVCNSHAISLLNGRDLHSLTAALLPLLSSGDLNAVSTSLNSLSRMVRKIPNDVVDQDLNAALCRITLSSVPPTVAEPFLAVTQDIGTNEVGAGLMQGLLRDVGVAGDAGLVGKAIGTLLVAAKQNLGVGLDDFIKELKNSKDPRRKCLALSVLGEAGFRLGLSSPLEPQLFSSHFTSKAETVPRAAAIALGRAGAGNVRAFLPVILETAGQGGHLQYLSLHAIREILQYGSHAREAISPFTQEIWQKLLGASEAEDSKVIGAECIGRLAVFDPAHFLPILQGYLKDSNPSIRGLAVQALRFTYTDHEDHFEAVLRPRIVKMLSIMLNDPNVENRGMAMGTFHSALNHKADDVLPYLGTLVPVIMKDTRPDPDLIREVKMGPFVHKVDDGLELRKIAYETVFTLLDGAYGRLNHGEVYDRFVAGLDDQHEVKLLCCLAVIKLITIDPEETIRRLDAIAEKFRTTLSFKPKENAVKQEMEKASEASQGVIGVTVRLLNAFPEALKAATTTQGHGWKAYCEWINKDFKNQLVAADQEIRNEA